MILPRDIEAERIILGTLMSDSESYHEVSAILTPDCFYDDVNRSVFKAIRSIKESGEEASPISVRDELKKCNTDIQFSKLTDMQIVSTYSVAILYQYACGIYDKCVRRKFHEAAMYLDRNAYYEDKDIEDVAEHANRMIADIFRDVQTGIVTLSDAINRTYKQVEQNSNGEKVATGTPTGFSKIDKKMGGLQAGELTIIAGETSQGKTSFALSISKNAAHYGDKVAIFSLEMTSIQLAARIMSIESGIPVRDILYSQLDTTRWQQLDKSISKIYDLPIFIDERATSNIDRIIASIRHLVLKYGIRGVVLDYLQILNVNMKGANKEQQTADVARRLKNLAKDLNIWIIALSQLNRGGNSHIPTVNRMRDSGQIEEAADNVWLVYRPEVYDSNASYPEPLHNESIFGTAMIDRAKGRNAGTERFLVGFDKSTTHFYELNGQMTKTDIKREDEPF